MKRLLFSIILMMIISGCASTGYNHSHYANIYQLKLNHPITVQAGSSYAYVTAPGKLVSRKDIGTYELYCKLAVPRPKDSGELIIAPDEFEINNIYRRNARIYYQPYNFQLAYNGGYGGLFGRNEASKRDLELFVGVSSINQPHVKSISCIRFADPYFGHTPTVAEMKHVFEGLAEFAEINN